jgi:hypothetical protein
MLLPVTALPFAATLASWRPVVCRVLFNVDATLERTVGHSQDVYGQDENRGLIVHFCGEPFGNEMVTERTAHVVQVARKQGVQRDAFEDA